MSKANSPEQTVALTNLVASIGCSTTLAAMGIVGAAFGLGYWLDNYFGTSPILMLISLIGSFPVTLYVIVRISLAAVARATRMREELEKEKLKEDKESS